MNPMSAMLHSPFTGHTAEYALDFILEQIQEFEDSLDDDHEVLVQLASFGQSIQMQVLEIRAENPNYLVFSGYVGNDYSVLIQHLSQLSFLLVAAKRPDPEVPARRIGFAPPSQE